MKKLLINIKELYGIQEGKRFLRGRELAELPSVKDAYVLVNDELIEDAGPMADISLKYDSRDFQTFDLSGQFVFPAWCDSHTHLVFAGSREGEFVDKIKGLSYAEIAARGGGILNSANKLEETSEAELLDLALQRIEKIKSQGTGAVEIKSGYGLSVDGELKMLRVIQQLKQRSDLIVKATFLGAHAVPLKFKENKQAYINLIIKEMLPAIGEEKLADFIDVFCETGFFSPEETIHICEAGQKFGLVPKLHVNQLNSIGGIEAGMELKALSLDHLETLTENDIGLLGSFQGAATVLPTAAFFLRMQMPPARKIIEANAALTLATDFNPGSSPSGNMNLAAAMSCIQMQLLPQEVINAATINGACAMGVQEETGSIATGKRANLIVTKTIPSLFYYFYSFGESHISNVMINGNWE